MTKHEYTVIVGIAAISALTLSALVLGVADGALASAIAAIGTLAGVKLALQKGG